MQNEEIARRFAKLTTALVSDAVFKSGAAPRLAPPGLKTANGRGKVAGRAFPVRHFGSVDVFLEALGEARKGDVLVIDTGGRTDEACIGDLTALEVRSAGLAGMLVWGLHRDTAELQEIDLPVLTYGSCPAGPQRNDPRSAGSPRFGEVAVTASDVVFADADGAVFVEEEKVADALTRAESIASTERRQAEAIRGGRSLREQLRFADYLKARESDPSYSLRQHLQKIGGAIEV